MDKTNAQLDPQIVALTKAIRTVESGGNFNARGKSGEYGAYQYIKPTWQETARKYLGNPNADIRDPKNQNKATYLKLKEWKDKGYNVGQIASMWNAGEGRPNAYRENWRGVNSQGVSYDTPAYAKKVALHYQKFKGVSAPVAEQVEAPAPTVDDMRAERIAQGEPVSVNKGKVNPSFVGGIARDVLKTPARILENVKAIPKIIKGQSFEQATQGSDSKYFGGKITPIGTEGNFAEKVKDAVGAGVELGSYAVGGEGAKVIGGVAKQAVKQGVKSTGKQILKKAGKLYAEGAAATALYEGGKRMQGEKDRGSFVKNVALGGAGAVALGAASAAAGKVAGQGRKLIAANISKNIPKDIETGAVNELKGAWDSVTDDYKNLRDFSTKQANKGTNSREITKILTDEVLVPELKDGVLETRKLIDEATDKITDYSVKSRDLLKTFDDVPTSIDELKAMAEKVVKDSTDINASGNINKALRELDNKLEGFRTSYGDTLNPTQLHDIRMEMNNITKAFNAEAFEQDVANSIGDAVRERLDKVVNDDIYRRTNRKIGDLLVVKQFLKKADGKKVGGGRLSQMLARLTGATIGSQAGLPIISPVIGAVVGDKAAKIARQWSFASPTTRKILRKVLKKDELASEIAGKTAKGAENKISREAGRLLPARTSTYNTKIESGKTINMPRRAQSTIDAEETANIIFSKVKKGDEIRVADKEYTVKLKTSKGAVLIDADGERVFVPKEKFKDAADVTDQNVRNEAESQVITEMEISQPGMRIFDESGVGTEVKAIHSTFPKWIPEDLRSKKLFDRMIEKMKENKVQSLGVKEKRLYETIMDKIRERSVDIKKNRSLKDLAKEYGADQAFVFAPFLAGGKIITDNDEYTSKKKGLFGNKISFERKDKGIIPPEKTEKAEVETLKYTPRPETDLPVKIKAESIRDIEKENGLPAGMLSAIMMLESSMGTNKASADAGEYKWLTGLTNIAIKDIKRKVNVGDPRDVLKATAEFLALIKKRYPNKTLGKLYLEHYGPEGLPEKKGTEFEKLLAYYGKE